MKKRSRNLAVSWLMPLGTLIQFMLPRWLVIRLARIIGSIAYRLSHHQRQRLIENYRHIFGPNTEPVLLDQTAYRAFQNLVLFYADLLRVPVLKKRTALLGELNLRHIEQVLKQNQGVILVTAHIGNWDLAGVFLGALGYRISAVVEPIPGGWTKTFNRYRRVCEMETIPIPEHHRIARALEKGRIVALVADRDLTGHGILCPAFDSRRSFPKGPAVYSIRHRVPIVVGYFVRQQKRNHPPYLGVIEPPIEFQPTDNMEADIINLTRIIAERLNYLIRCYPDQWLVFNAGWQ
ncbi:MAG: lysophospholipid acyltransferase family protein [bacterium]|jgi:KDO2-lipid IV(A) lauroyltransferase